MKTIMKSIMLTICLAVAVAFAMNVATSTDVAAKSKVTYKLKKGTPTIKGKGDMPKKIKVKKSKVKKIVIKKGVKSISNSAFKNFKKAKKISIASTVKKIGVSAFEKTAVTNLTIPKKATKLGQGFIDNCKKLDKLTVPGNFKIINKKGAVQPHRYGSYGTTLETVTFNTNLDYQEIAYFKAYNFVTSKSDPNFKDYGGVIYTKDGTNVVRVPSERVSVTLRTGCTDFNPYAVTYSTDNERLVCNQLVKVVLPTSVVRVNDEKYPDDPRMLDSGNGPDIVFENTKMEIPEIVKLKNRFNISADSLLKKAPGRIVKSGSIYVGDTKYLVEGTAADTVYVPGSITTICDKAYYNVDVKTVKLPNTCTEIGENAFESSTLSNINLDDVKKMGKGAFRFTQFQTAELPASMTSVPEQLFYDCQMLKEVTFKGDVTTIGADAFYNTSLNLQDVLNNNTKIKTIGSSAFENVAWSNLTIPENIVNTGDRAFFESTNSKFVTISGNTAGFNANTFGTRMGITYSFTKGISQAFTNADYDWYTSGKNKKLALWWDKVDDISGYDIWIGKDAKLTKGVKKYTAKFNEKSKTITIATKKAKGLAYFGIRPYKTVDGKKVVGKWAINKL